MTSPTKNSTDPWTGVVHFLAELRERRRQTVARRRAALLDSRTLADIGMTRLAVQYGNESA